ncbi:MAG: double zinc ribbon domain-containing protein [Blastocatellia bacterium]
MLARAIRNVRDGIVASVYPEQCRLCGQMIESYDDGVACLDCWKDSAITRLIADPACVKCAAPLHTTTPYATPLHVAHCGSCNGFAFSAARACGIYSGAIEASILFLKSHPHICRRLRAIITETYSKHSLILANDIIVPVPLHRSREMERGFNQARVLAKIICSDFQLNMDDRLLVRVKRTERHRAGLDLKDRARSVERAFEVTSPEALQGARVLLVDDLFTTGSTIAAATKALLEDGAARVNVFTIARVAEKA